MDSHVGGGPRSSPTWSSQQELPPGGAAHEALISKNSPSIVPRMSPSPVWHLLLVFSVATGSRDLNGGARSFTLPPPPVTGERVTGANVGRPGRASGVEGGADSAVLRTGAGSLPDLTDPAQAPGRSEQIPQVNIGLATSAANRGVDAPPTMERRCFGPSLMWTASSPHQRRPLSPMLVKTLECETRVRKVLCTQSKNAPTVWGWWWGGGGILFSFPSFLSLGHQFDVQHWGGSVEGRSPGPA
jgi:hypothetical protein